MSPKPKVKGDSKDALSAVGERFGSRKSASGTRRKGSHKAAGSSREHPAGSHEPGVEAASPARDKLHELGWQYGRDGRLRRCIGAHRGSLYSREHFRGDYHELATAISNFVVERFQQPPWHFELLRFKDEVPEGISQQVFASPGALSHPGHLLLLIPGIGCRAGIWSKSLCATDSLGRGAMFEFAGLAEDAGMATVIFDPNDDSDPHNGESFVIHCLQAWREVIENSAASELFIVAHSFAGASLMDMLASASEEALTRIRGIAFTDSVHFVSDDCLQTRKGGLPPMAHDVLRRHALFWQADTSPLDTELWEFNEDRGCRVVSAGVDEHASTNAYSCCSIFRHFASQAEGELALPDDLEHIENKVRALAGRADKDGSDLIRRAFQEWDMDGDGTISEDELTHIIHQLCPGIPAGALSELFAVVDTKKDGEIDYTEFVFWLHEEKADDKPGRDDAEADAPAVKPAVSKAAAKAAGSKAAAKAAGSKADARAKLHGLNPQREYVLPGDGKLYISTGNIINFTGDAIVNAANRGGCGGGGVDGAITRAGGPELAAARRALPVLSGIKTKVRIPTGEARMTIGGRLKARFCIHAVGPIYHGDLSEGDKLLFDAYKAAMACAAEEKLGSIGFSLLSSGIFRGKQTLARVVELAVEGIAGGVYEGLQEVHLIGFKPDEIRALEAACDKHLGP